MSGMDLDDRRPSSFARKMGSSGYFDLPFRHALPNGIVVPFLQETRYRLIASLDSRILPAWSSGSSSSI
jgi:hypothetical protein